MAVLGGIREVQQQHQEHVFVLRSAVLTWPSVPISRVTKYGPSPKLLALSLKTDSRCLRERVDGALLIGASEGWPCLRASRWPIHDQFSPRASASYRLRP